MQVMKKEYVKPEISDLSVQMTLAGKENQASEQSNPAPGMPGMGPS